MPLPVIDDADVAAIAKGLSGPMRAMLVASDPDDVTGEEGSGVELLSGADYAVAKALKRRNLGYIVGPGSPLCGMFWSNHLGLLVREHLARTGAPE